MEANKQKKRTGLGKGLGALLEDSAHYQKDKENFQKEYIYGKHLGNEILIHQIETNPWQPRTDFDKISIKELAESIKIQGIIQPITVRQLNDKTYQLISGERRLQASKIAGLESIPTFIRKANDQQMLEMALIENIQREDLNAIEIALSYQRLLSECKLKQEKLGERVGKNRSTVSNYLRLLKLPPDIQIAIRDKQLSMGHARSLISIEDPILQLSIFNQIIENDLSVRKSEELVRTLSKKNIQKNSVKREKSTSEIENLQSKLTSHFGTKILVKANDRNKGEIKIPFTSTEDLNRILEILSV